MPPFEVEALDTHAWSTRHIERDVRARGWTRLDVPRALPLVVYGRDGSTGSDLLTACLQSASSELAVVRMAIRQDTPNLEIQWRLAGFEAKSSRRLFEAFQQTAERIRDESLTA
jgi:hypothetical protein